MFCVVWSIYFFLCDLSCCLANADSTKTNRDSVVMVRDGTSADRTDVECDEGALKSESNECIRMHTNWMQETYLHHECVGCVHGNQCLVLNASISVCVTMCQSNMHLHLCMWLILAVPCKVRQVRLTLTLLVMSRRGEDGDFVERELRYTDLEGVLKLEFLRMPIQEDTTHWLNFRMSAKLFHRRHFYSATSINVPCVP